MKCQNLQICCEPTCTWLHSVIMTLIACLHRNCTLIVAYMYTQYIKVILNTSINGHVCVHVWCTVHITCTCVVPNYISPLQTRNHINRYPHTKRIVKYIQNCWAYYVWKPIWIINSLFVNNKKIMQCELILQCYYYIFAWFCSMDRW